MTAADLQTELSQTKLLLDTITKDRDDLQAQLNKVGLVSLYVLFPTSYKPLTAYD